MQTRKRQSENNNAINEQHKKNKVQNNDTKAKEINCTTKWKLPTQTISGSTKKQKIHDMKKLIKPKHNIKKLFIKVPNILFSLHHEENKKILTKAKQDNILCKQYGYNFKIPLIHLKNIPPKNTNKKTTESNISNTVKYKYGRNFDESIKIFNELTSHGPIYVCSICQQTNFIDKVTEIAKLHKTKNSNLLNECRTNYKSIDNKEYICYTCKKYIYKGKIPKLSIKNGCGFPKKPNELDLFNLEERFISPVMAFMLIHQLFPGGQFSLYGSICHLPIEIGKVISTLPRSLNQCETIAVKLKCRLCYKNSVISENVRPQKIINALQYLLRTSELYKQHNINIDPEWLQTFSNTTDDHEDEEDLRITNNNIVNNSSDDEVKNSEEEPNAPSINTFTH